MGQKEIASSNRSDLYECRNGRYEVAYKPVGQETEPMPSQRKPESKSASKNSNTLRCKDWRSSKRAQGFVPVQGWVQSSDKVAFDAFAEQFDAPGGLLAAMLSEPRVKATIEQSRQEGRREAQAQWLSEKGKLATALSDAEQTCRELTAKVAVALDEKATEQRTSAKKTDDLLKELNETRNRLRKSEKSWEKLRTRIRVATIAAAVGTTAISFAWMVLPI